MTVEEFLSWLAVTDLAKRDRYETREMLSSFLNQLPDDPEYDELADTLERHAEDPKFIPDHLAGLYERFRHLLPEPPSPLEAVEDELDEIAQELEPESLQTDRLLQFEEILRGLDENPSAARERRLRERLAALENQFCGIWNDYLKLQVAEAEVTAESVAGHRCLKDAFNLWFQAFQQANQLELDEAWESACEGNRLLLTVSTWSDGIRQEHSAEIARG